MSEHLRQARKLMESGQGLEETSVAKLWDTRMAVWHLLFHLESHPSPVPQTPESEETRSSSPDTVPTVETLTGSNTFSATFSLVKTDIRGNQVLAVTSLGPNSRETVGDVLRLWQGHDWSLPALETQGSQWQSGHVPSTLPAAPQDGPRAGGGERWQCECGYPNARGNDFCWLCFAARRPSSPSPAIHAQGEEA